jgi:hypothetical protein
MATKESLSQIPKKFKKTGKSFLPKLLASNNSSFSAFPKDMSFNGKEKDEEVVLIIRAHWIVYFPQVLGALLLMFLPFMVYFVLGDLFSNILLFIGLLIATVLISISILITTFMKWYYNVNIVTDQKVLDLDFVNALSHNLAEAQLEKIEDVSHKTLGLVSSIFDIGTVYIQTAGAKAEIEFQNIPRPRDVQDIIYDLLELKQEGTI